MVEMRHVLLWISLVAVVAPPGAARAGRSRDEEHLAPRPAPQRGLIGGAGPVVAGAPTTSVPGSSSGVAAPGDEARPAPAGATAAADLGDEARPAPAPGAADASRGAAGAGLDPAVLEQLRELEARIAAIEALLGPDLQLGATLESLKAHIAQDEGMRVSWRDGLRFEDDDVQVRIGGRIQLDNTFASGDSDAEASVGALEDGSEFRRARIYLRGSLYDQAQWKMEYDFKDGDTDFTDVYMQLDQLPVVDNLRIGHFKEPFSLEFMASSNDATFMERGLPHAFVPSRNTGVGTLQTFAGDRGSVQVALFREGSDRFGDSADDGSTAVTARVSGLVVDQPEHERLVHLGVGASKRSPDEDTVRYASRPEANLLQSFVDTGSFAAEDVALLGLEAAWVEGPFSLQAEYIQADVHSDEMADPRFDGAYVLASYFLTGESRPYERGENGFGRIVPHEPFITAEGDKGPGAWELAGRWSTIDLEDAGVSGGELEDFTLGVNWYLSRSLRWMFNYIRADMDGSVDGNADLFLMRWQVTF